MVQINNSADLVNEAADNVANAIGGTARATEERGRTLSGVAQSVSVVASQAQQTYDKIEKQRQYATANGIVTNANSRALQFDEALSKTSDIPTLQKSQQEFQTYIESASEQAKKAGLDPDVLATVQSKLQNQYVQQQIKFNKAAGKSIASAQFKQLQQSAGLSAANNSGNDTHAPFMQEAKGLIDNPYATRQQKQFAANVHSNYNFINDGQPEESLKDPQAQAAVDAAVQNASGSKWMKGLVNGMLFNGQTASQALAPYMGDKTSEFQNKANIVSDIQKSYSTFSHTHNFMGLMNASVNSNGASGVVSRQYKKMLDGGNGGEVIRSLNDTANQWYKVYQQDPTPDNWQNYQTYEHATAKQLGIPFSKIGSLSQTSITNLVDLDKQPLDADYSSNIWSQLNKMNQLNGENPVYGSGKYSQRLRMFKYGDSNGADFPSFISDMDTNRQTGVNKAYSQQGLSNSDATDYVGDNVKSMNTIATLTQTPLNVVQSTFSTAYKQFRMQGLDDGEAEDKLNTIMQSYTNNKGIGSNYILPQGYLDDLGIQHHNADDVVHNAIHLVLQKHINEMAAKQESENKSIPLEAYKTRLEDSFGKASDYTLIESNGNIYAKNNENDRLFNVPDNVLRNASDHTRHIESTKVKMISAGMYGITTRGLF